MSETEAMPIVDREMVRLAKIVLQGDYELYVLRSDPDARQRMASRLLAEHILRTWEDAGVS